MSTSKLERPRSVTVRTPTRTSSNGAPPKSAPPGGRVLKKTFSDEDLLQSPLLSQPDLEAPVESGTPRLPRFGSPRRPMSARLAFRRQERGVPLRSDLYVAPTIMWSQRLGVHPRALPLFPDKSKFKVVEDPRAKLEEVLCIIVDLLKKHSYVKETTEDSGVGGKATKTTKSARLPLGLKKFTGKAPVSNEPVETDNDAAGLERKIMDQTRKLSTHLEAAWKSSALGLRWQQLSSRPNVGAEIKNSQLAQALTQKLELTRAELDQLNAFGGQFDLRQNSYIRSEDFRYFRPAGDVILDESEVEAINYIIKHRILPILDKRIEQLQRIIAEMMPENMTTTKETPQSQDRDLLSYQAELERRTVARQAMQQDLRNITKKLIEVKSSRKFDRLNKHAACLRLQRDQLETSVVNVEKDVAKGRAAEDKASFAQRIVALMKSQDPKEQIQGIEHFAIEGAKMLKRASAQDSEQLRSLLVGHIFSRHLSVRTVAAPLLSREQLVFNHVPVQETPPKPESKEDHEVHTNYENKKADNDLILELFSLAVKSSYGAQETFLQEIYKALRIEDKENLYRLYDFLKSPNAIVRVVAMRSLAKHTSGYGSLETAERIAEMQTDPEWIVRSAVCEVLPNIAGILFTLVPRPTLSQFRHSQHQTKHKHQHVSHEDDEVEELTQEQIDYEIEHKKDIHFKFKTGVRQAERFAHRQKEMILLTTKVLEHLLNDKSQNTRRAAICFYSKVGTPGTMHSASLLFKGCKDRSALVRAASFRCLPSIINRTGISEDEAVGASIEKKKTIEWLVEELVAFMDPEKALQHWKETMTPAEWKAEMTPGFKKEIRSLAVRALVGDDTDTIPVNGVVHKGHLRVIQGMLDLIRNGTTELQSDLLEMIPEITTRSSEHHSLAVLVVVQCLASPSDCVRHTACLIVEKLIGPRDSSTIGQLVTLLGAGREKEQELSAGVKRSAIALLQNLGHKTGLRDDALKVQRTLLNSIAFGLQPEGHEFHQYDEESIMEPMLDLEAKILDSYSSDTYVAKGLGCKLKSGTSGYDPAHWKRQLFLLTKEGALFMTSARSKGEAPTRIFSESDNFAASRVAYGSVVPNAVKFEVVHEAANGTHKEVTVLGFFTKDEIMVWFRDIQAIVARNIQRAAHEMKGKERVLQIKDKEEEPDGVGRTATRLNAFIEELINPIAVEKNDLEAKQQLVQRKLDMLLHDKVAFVEALSEDKLAQMKVGKHGGEKSQAPSSNKSGLPKPTVSQEEEKSRRAAFAEANYMNVKLDMATFLDFLRKNELYGKTGFTDHAVRHAWKAANAGDASGVDAASHDKDKMKLDWDEYQACIRILAKRAGVSLTTDVAGGGNERYFVFILGILGSDFLVMRPEYDWIETLVSTWARLLSSSFHNIDVCSGCENEALEAIGALLAKHWNDPHLFHKFSAGAVQGPSKMSAHVFGDSHMKTVDYREFLHLCSSWKIFPGVLSKTRLSDIFKEANTAEDANDEGGHELTFEEWKRAMIGIASALNLPIMCNGRNLASQPKFVYKTEINFASMLK